MESVVHWKVSSTKCTLNGRGVVEVLAENVVGRRDGNVDLRIVHLDLKQV